MAKRKKLKVSKYKNGKLLIISFIIILSVVAITFPFKSNAPTIPNEQTNIRDTIIYPGSTKKVVSENGGKTSINYRTQSGISYQSVISYYINELPKLGWKLVSQSEVDANFEKGERKLRVWILYIPNNLDAGVDYIFDYQEQEATQLPLY